MNKSYYALFIAFTYFIVSFAWILISDKLLLSITSNNEALTNMQILNGWFFISITTICIYLIIKYTFIKAEKSKDELKNIFNSLASPIIIYSEDGKVLMINKIFEKITGYKHKEIDTIDKWTYKAYGVQKEEVKNLIYSMFSINKIVDNGTLEITTKDLSKKTWHFNCAPFGKKNGKKMIIVTALDVTELKEKEKIMIQQSKMAAMGEILENIAHQWRQPLSSISTASTGVKLQSEYGLLTNDILKETMSQINSSAQHLSKTIDDFRGFFKPDQKKVSFKIKHTLEKTLMIIGSKFNGEEINFITNIDDFKIINYNNALIQVFLNIFTNSKDAFNEKEIKNRYIFIDIFKDEYTVTIQIKDNAGGIPSKVIGKIFEPYFTTKHQNQGTGIGLYMSEEIITKHMRGKIKVENSKFLHEKEKYTGAMFTITLPLKI